MRLRKSIITMELHRRLLPAGVLHAGRLLLCLALLLLASVAARPAPSDNVPGSNSDITKQHDQERSRAQENRHSGKSAMPLSGANEDDGRDGIYVDESTTQTLGMDHRMLEDYGPPAVADNPRPSEPYP